MGRASTAGVKGREGHSRNVCGLLGGLQLPIVHCEKQKLLTAESGESAMSLG